MQIRELHHRAEEIIEAVRPKRRVSLYVMDALMGLAIFICLMALILRPKEASQAAQEGIKLCLDVIVPSLFPFFVLSTLIVELGLARYLGKALERVMRPLFKVGGACSAAVVLGFIGGYPVGAMRLVQYFQIKKTFMFLL